ncbi:MAG: hypothetical protein ACO395_10215 [Pontimonas sp.]
MYAIQNRFPNGVGNTAHFVGTTEEREAILAYGAAVNAAAISGFNGIICLVKVDEWGTIVTLARTTMEA